MNALNVCFCCEKQSLLMLRSFLALSQLSTPFLSHSDVVSYITKLINIVTNFLSCFKNYQCKENFEPHHLHCSDSDCLIFAL